MNLRTNSQPIYW